MLCTSEGRTAKDRAIREKQEGRFLADLERLKAADRRGRLKREIKIGEAIGRLKQRYPRVARYHTVRYDRHATAGVMSPTPTRRPRPSCSMGVICCGPIARI